MCIFNNSNDDSALEIDFDYIFNFDCFDDEE